MGARRRRLRSLGLAAAGFVVGAALSSGCGKTAHTDPKPGTGPGDPIVCGPCYSPLLGDDSISGVAAIDGFFRAWLRLTQAIEVTRVDFEGNVRALCALYGIDASGNVDSALVNALITAMNADVTDATTNGLSVHYAAPLCSADLGLASKAEGECESQAGCDVSSSPEGVVAPCDGECTGGCDAACTGELGTCVAHVENAPCDGDCRGGCQLETPAECPGVCHGTCHGTCDGPCTGGARDASGRCAGTCDGPCDGTCTGICELTDPAPCPGPCAGTCSVPSGSATCAAGSACRGTCEGACAGKCTGLPTPPANAVDCEATTRCQPQARAEGGASLDCEPPVVELSFDLNTAAGGGVQATFLSHIAEVKRRAPSIVRDAVRLGLLVSGDPKRAIPSVLDELRNALSAFDSADAIAPFDVVPGRLLCVVPAFVDSRRRLDDLKTELAGTLEAQAALLAYLTTGKP